MNLLEKTLSSITDIDTFFENKAKERLDNLIKPIGSLGRLEDICIQLGGIYRRQYFDTSKKAVISFAGDHGVYEEGVAPNPQQITKEQIPNFAKGITGVGTLARFSNAKVVAVDVGVKCDEKLEGVLDYKIRKGTSNIAKGPAMSREEAIRCFEIGIEVAENLIKDGYTVIGIGEMGIGNTTPSSAIVSVFGNFDPIDVTGMGSGLTPERIVKKADVIRNAIKLNSPDKNDAIDVLAKVGGFEIGAMAGAILGCSANNIPVVLDGFISYAAALLAYNLNPLTKKYMISSHYSAEPGSQKAFNLLGLTPMLHMEMRLGEGSGAALLFNIIEAANFSYTNMRTVDEMDMVL